MPVGVHDYVVHIDSNKDDKTMVVGDHRYSLCR